MAYTTLTALSAAIAADAGENSGDTPQSAYTAIGGIEGARREGPPRVVWMPGDGELDEPNQDESVLSKIGYTHRLECTVRFLGADFDAADTLMRHWLAALQRTQGNNCCRPIRTNYRDETLTGTARHEIILTCEVDLPIPFETYTAADVQNTAQTGTITE